MEASLRVLGRRMRRLIGLRARYLLECEPVLTSLVVTVHALNIRRYPEVLLVVYQRTRNNICRSLGTFTTPRLPSQL